MNEFLKENRYIIMLLALISMFLFTAIHGYHDGEPELAKEAFDLVKQFSAAILTIMVPKIASGALNGNKPPEAPKP
jgi:hypothetical protein